ncbi:MAG: hypothetical protein PHI28_15100 [Mangrovibacterium sp.]|nr:hypothetical protein [Mangrovibacterium sp.]
MKALLVPILLIIPEILLQAQEMKNSAGVSAISIEQISQKYEQLLGVKNDWPGLGRYREENQKLGPPGRNENRVVFMGNSITEFWVRDSRYKVMEPLVEKAIEQSLNKKHIR